MWDSNFTDEVLLQFKGSIFHGLKFRTLAYNSYEFSFAEESLKRELVQGFKQDLELFEKQFSESNWQTYIGRSSSSHSWIRSLR